MTFMLENMHPSVRGRIQQHEHGDAREHTLPSNTWRALREMYDEQDPRYPLSIAIPTPTPTPTSIPTPTLNPSAAAILPPPRLPPPTTLDIDNPQPQQ
ncbi:hypothetical protein CLCR_02181 [Cladophialophora carrionii]|uniref:Uncharacterized protein n=1 Tax=Cladophialophora carrionii TaxID=86049 RepID=A0A1C1CE05_9EURO|nr:hypothetical protein CLCR_02181 [Cladophialophora carrionii]